MKQNKMDLGQAFIEVSASSAGGTPFLIAYGTTFLITGTISFALPAETVALVAMFQGGVALPTAFWLERQIGWERLSTENPLRALSTLLAFSQALAIPALIVVFNLNPRAVPVILAGLGGVHFLPYAWLHRTRLYVVLALIVSLGAFGLQLVLGSTAFHVNLLYMGVVYWLFAPAVYRHARSVKVATDTAGRYSSSRIDF